MRWDTTRAASSGPLTSPGPYMHTRGLEPPPDMGMSRRALVEKQGQEILHAAPRDECDTTPRKGGGAPLTPRWLARHAAHLYRLISRPWVSSTYSANSGKSSSSVGLPGAAASSASWSPGAVLLSICFLKRADTTENSWSAPNGTVSTWAAGQPMAQHRSVRRECTENSPTQGRVEMALLQSDGVNTP